MGYLWVLGAIAGYSIEPLVHSTNPLEDNGFFLWQEKGLHLRAEALTHTSPARYLDGEPAEADGKSKTLFVLLWWVWITAAVWL